MENCSKVSCPDGFASWALEYALAPYRMDDTHGDTSHIHVVHLRKDVDAEKPMPQAFGRVAAESVTIAGCRHVK
jgi:hypothetical protein